MPDETTTKKVVTLAGVRIKSVDVEVGEEETKSSGKYDLMSSDGKVVAKQGFNGYHDIKLTLSPNTVVLRDKFLTALSEDVEKVLGFFN